VDKTSCILSFVNRPIDPGELSSNPGNPEKLDNFLNFISVFLRPSVIFETGAQEEIQAHRELGGNFLLIMTHFRRIGPGHLGSATTRHEVLAPLPHTTVVTARRELGEWPILGGYVRSAKIVWVDRASEHEGESPEERAKRQSKNDFAIETGAQSLANGDDSIIWPESTTRIKTIKRNGKIKKKARPSGELLDIRPGVGRMISKLTPEQRRNVRILGVAEHYGSRLKYLRPSLAITRPEMPLEGDEPKIWLEQSRLILQRGLDLAMLHDSRR
jgi:hypothetical protein